ncbi:unnamed protein product [Leptidea sinapis]|uniref:HAUS augmin-like complex subunit 3 N-terminal domain-containing protein n=1 Tax=Leptidea sinapis TaxID=189913 RepID=A0A5E4QEP8_9NEOP|nr:unnamed protein product [Leptidea sinapis]
MSTSRNIKEEDFVGFLNSLGVETYNQSIGWMLSNRKFSDALQWIYHNVDENNSLTAIEEYRYADIEKKGALLSTEELEDSVLKIQQEYKGIVLPGDHESLEYAKLDVQLQKERLNMLLKQEVIVKEMIDNNKATKDALNIELTKLCATERCLMNDELSFANECVKSAEEVETVLYETMDIVANTLDAFETCKDNKDLYKKYYAFGPFKQLKHSQALFRSHYDLYSKSNINIHRHTEQDIDAREALHEAKRLDSRLVPTIVTYVETKVELSGEQAKLNLATNYTNVHPSQIKMRTLEARSAVDLLEQEEANMVREISCAARQRVEIRNNLALVNIGKTSYSKRLEALKALKYLKTVTREAFVLDNLIYRGLLREFGCVEDMLHFSTELTKLLKIEGRAVRSRIRSMDVITLEHLEKEKKLSASNDLMQFLCQLYGIDTKDPTDFVKANNELKCCINDLNETVIEKFSAKEDAISQREKAASPLVSLVWSGASKQPESVSVPVSLMLHALSLQMEMCNQSVSQTSSKFTTIRSGDKNNDRKRWQWFLTDPQGVARHQTKKVQLIAS